MIRLGRSYFPISLPIAQYYFRIKAVMNAQRFNKEIQKHDFIYKAIFDRNTYDHVITKDKSAAGSKFPIWVGEKEFTIEAHETIYVTPSLYHKLKSKLRFSGVILLNNSELQDIKTKLNNTKFNISKFYIFLGTPHKLKRNIDI